jgi:hypothetical protein
VHALLLTEHGFLCWEAKISYRENPRLLKLKTITQIERRIVMWKKLLILSLSIAVLFVFSAPITPVDAGNKSIPINWRVAGSIINSVKTTGAVVDQTLINLSALGSPGPAELTILGDWRFADPEADPPEEVPGCNLTLIFDHDEFVAVFPDLSLLFAKLMEDGDAYLCVVYGVGTTFTFDMEIIGGTGRFDGATGEFTATGVGHGDDFDGPLSAESGEFIGEIELP